MSRVRKKSFLVPHGARCMSKRERRREEGESEDSRKIGALKFNIEFTISFAQMWFTFQPKCKRLRDGNCAIGADEKREETKKTIFFSLLVFFASVCVCVDCRCVWTTNVYLTISRKVEIEKKRVEEMWNKWLSMGIGHWEKVEDETINTCLCRLSSSFLVLFECGTPHHTRTCSPSIK